MIRFLRTVYILVKDGLRMIRFSSTNFCINSSRLARVPQLINRFEQSMVSKYLIEPKNNCIAQGMNNCNSF